MKKVIWVVGFLLVIGHIQLEFSSWYYKIFGSKNIYPVIKSSEMFDWYHQKGISIEWWIKMVSDDFLSIITFAAMAIVLKRFSHRLYLISIVFLSYHVFDHFMLWYNYKTSWWLYIVELLADIIAVIILVKVKDKKQAVVKSLI